MDILEIFASNVFDDRAMELYLKPDTFKSLKTSVATGCPIDTDKAKEIADAMKNWAVSKGATHFTHWFQPMNGITAEKHDGFISFKDGKPILEFSGKELIKGESDASSFPNGGTRATFEARGYTAWDPTSYAFIKEKTLCIPTCFCAYSGEALDKKTPLLRSCDTLNKEVVTMLKFFGRNVSNININAGAEQEYFLIDKKLAEKRLDLLLTGRTLFGASPAKGQELEDHYYGTIKPRVKSFMEELDTELWKLGIYAKTEHNEVAPSQHELASVYSKVNITTDNNQLTMEFMKKIADKHGLLCLLNEKPFAGINGSGKHNNYSISTPDGENLFNPGESPETNYIFLLLLCGIIEGADNYQDLLRLSVASASNDNRLGANEAPPAIISIYLGSDLYDMLLSFGTKDTNTHKKQKMNLGATAIPTLYIDSTDRNRTSPLAFTGNKFEFRMVGSSQSIADANIILNTSLAESVLKYNEKLKDSDDVIKTAKEIIIETVRKHQRILFNGNNYSKEWEEEAERRGLLNIHSTPEAIKTLTEKKNIDLFTKHSVYSVSEINSRQMVLFENYSRIINIEAITSLEMVKKEIYPSIQKYIKEVISTIKLKEELGIKSMGDINLVKKLASLSDRLLSKAKELEKNLKEAKLLPTLSEQASYYHDTILSGMKMMRNYSDEAESLTSKEYWPFPTYEDLLYLQ